MTAGILDGAAGIWVNSRESVWFAVAAIGQEIGWLEGMKIYDVDEQYSVGKFRYTDKAKADVKLASLKVSYGN